MIQTGAELPLPTGYQGIQYQAVTTGFLVTPRLAGNGRVTLDLAPWSDRPVGHDRGLIATQQIHSRLTAELGEWVEVGGVTRQQASEATGTLYRNTAEHEDTQRIFLKVTDLDAGSP